MHHSEAIQTLFPSLLLHSLNVGGHFICLHLSQLQIMNDYLLLVDASCHPWYYKIGLYHRARKCFGSCILFTSFSSYFNFLSYYIQFQHKKNSNRIPPFPSFLSAICSMYCYGIRITASLPHVTIKLLPFIFICQQKEGGNSDSTRICQIIVDINGLTSAYPESQQWRADPTVREPSRLDG